MKLMLSCVGPLCGPLFFFALALLTPGAARAQLLATFINSPQTVFVGGTVGYTLRLENLSETDAIRLVGFADSLTGDLPEDAGLTTNFVGFEELALVNGNLTLAPLAVFEVLGMKVTASPEAPSATYDPINASFAFTLPDATEEEVFAPWGITVAQVPPTAAPEPASLRLFLFVAALTGVAAYARNRRAAAISALAPPLPPTGTPPPRRG